MSMIISLVTFLILLLIVNLMTSFMWGIPHFWSRLIWSPYSPNHPIALNWGKFQFRPTALTSQLELCSIAKYMNRSFGSIQWETRSLFRILCDKRILFITRIWTRTLQLGSYATPMAMMTQQSAALFPILGLVLSSPNAQTHSRRSRG